MRADKNLRERKKESPQSTDSIIYLAPVRLDLNGLACVLQGVLIVCFLRVGSRSVAEEDMVVWVQCQCLGVAAHCFIKLPRAQRLITLVFQLRYLRVERHTDGITLREQED